MPKTFAALLIFIGSVWIIQGLGLTPTGSFMDDQPEWAAIGGTLVLTGTILALRKRGPRE